MYGVEENSMSIAHPRTPRRFSLDTTLLPHNVSQRLNSMRLQRIRFDVVSGCRFYGLTRCATAPVPAQQHLSAAVQSVTGVVGGRLVVCRSGADGYYESAIVGTSCFQFDTHFLL